MDGVTENTGKSAFDKMKKTREDGSTYWDARELKAVLGYQRWDKFHRVIKRAMLGCKNSGFDVHQQFLPIDRSINLRSGGQRNIRNFQLSRYACYLIVQNCDPRIELVAQAKSYIILQTMRQELSDDTNDGSELAMKLFIATQTAAKIRREGITGKEAADKISAEVKDKVLQTMKDLGPEHRPALSSRSNLE